MPNLNSESKLITPGGALMTVLIGGAIFAWYFDVDVWQHLQGIRETVRYVTGGIL